MPVLSGAWQLVTEQSVNIAIEPGTYTVDLEFSLSGMIAVPAPVPEHPPLVVAVGTEAGVGGGALPSVTDVDFGPGLGIPGYLEIVKLGSGGEVIPGDVAAGEGRATSRRLERTRRA